MTNIEPRSSRDEPPPATGFWRRQFQTAPTWRQTAFDIVFGVLAPIACVIVDRILFEDFPLGGVGSFFGQFAAFIYLFMAVTITALGIRLATRVRSVVLAGVLWAGFAFATCLGIVLLPLALATLHVFGIGFLALTPLFTSFVFLRNGVRSFTGARTCRSWIGIALATAAFGMTILIPRVADRQLAKMTTEAINVIANGKSEQIDTAVRRLKMLRRVKSVDALVEKYAEMSEEQDKKAIAEAYAAITGEDIERRLSSMRD